MSYFKYLREHAGWLAIWLFLVSSLEIMLLTMKGSATLMIYVGIAITITIFLGTFLDYRKTKKFVTTLETSMESLDKKYLLPELLEPASSSDQQIYIAIIKQMEQSMADNIADYRRRSEEYRDYIVTWVHEVKIPIATAGMIIENHRDEAVREVGIDAEIKRIQNYVEQALFFARSEAVEKDYIIKELDLEEIASSVIYDKKRILREKRASVDIHDMSPAKKVFSDGKWLAFIMSQIIDNSIKYAKEDCTLSLEIFVTEEADSVALHIKDNGIGMNSSELGRAFDKGFTGTNGRNVSASTGMGLYLCKRLCDRLEHELSVESTENEGTEMIITI
ncbi:MAG: sensor histidine kinase [Lachnospiraceae bacterium]|nr:sensor histidine kinase [Lachnospiraceae bacterium]